MQDMIIAALALNGIICTTALVWLLRKAARRREDEWPDELDWFDAPDKLEPPDPEAETFGRYPSSEIFSIMAEHYPATFQRYRLGQIESAERLQVWDVCCAIHDARFEIEELCS